MEIKKWKKFSDEIDSHTEKKYDKLINGAKNLQELDCALKLFEETIIEKTEINFMEWQIGKLKLNN